MDPAAEMEEGEAALEPGKFLSLYVDLLIKEREGFQLYEPMQTLGSSVYLLMVDCTSVPCIPPPRPCGIPNGDQETQTVKQAYKKRIFTGKVHIFSNEFQYVKIIN